MEYLTQEKPRQKEWFGFDWHFALEGDGAQLPGEGLAGYRAVQLPHDWSVEYPFDENADTCGSGGYVRAGVGWYKKSFRLASGGAGTKQFSLLFDGAYMCATVWLNGQEVGGHIYGYTPFEVDITKALRFDADNEVMVRIDNAHQPNSRWYTGSGITRNVWLCAVQPAHIETDGTFVRALEITPGNALMQADTRVALPQGQSAVLHTRFVDAEGHTVAQCETAVEATGEVCQQLALPTPTLWSNETPYLYKMLSTLTVGGQLCDEYETPFGVRSAVFDADKGFLLNGKQVKLNGFCVHHDGGGVGAAVPPEVWRRRLQKLKAMGANALRAAHNPPDPALLDLCDELGFLVMDEAFDEWGILKAKELGSNTHESRGYSEWFAQCHVQDITAMLRRDRNHPSIVLWSIGNEVPEQTHPEGHLVARELQNICHQMDPTRLCTQANDQICAEPRAATAEFLNTLDIVGYNYTARWRTRAETLYDDDKRANPGWRIIGTENISMAGKRGEYAFTVPSGSYWSSTYFSTPVTVGKLLRYTMTHDYVAGDFMWTGVDYLGEAHWPERSSSAGVLDTAGFEKDGYYFYKSVWNRAQPMVHAFPHWNLPLEAGAMLPLVCCTNCASAEVFVDGKSYGKKAYAWPMYGMTETYGHFDTPPEPVNTDDLFLSWDVPFTPGEVLVLGYDSEGRELCRQSLQTTGVPVRLRAAADAESLAADGRSVAHVEIWLEDENGRLVPNAALPLAVRTDGALELLALDNGDPTGMESFKGSSMHSYGGKLLALVRAGRQAGPGAVEISGPGLAGCRVEIPCR